MKKVLLTMGLAAFLTVAGTASAAPTAAEQAAKCAASLRKCCGKVFLGIVLCHAKGAVKTTTDTTDPVCVDTARGKYNLCAGKALAKGGCITDQAGMDHLEDEIENQWAADVKDDTPVAP